MHSRRSNVPQTARPASAWGQGAVAWSARPLLRWAFWLWLLAAATAVVGLLLEPRNTSLFYGQRMLRLWVPGQDSWRPMVTAIELLRADPGQALYSHLFFDLGEKFQYPVTSLLPLDLLQRFWGAPLAPCDPGLEPDLLGGRVDPGPDVLAPAAGQSVPGCVRSGP